MQTKLNQTELHKRFLESLKNSVVYHSGINEKPLEVDLKSPLPKKIRLYIYNSTHPPGGRTLGEHKVQLIVPGQSRGERASFDHSGGRIVLLCGYQVEVEVFILWDASLYHDFAFSRNVQVKAETIYEAFAGNIGRQQRSLRTTSGTQKETVLTAKSSLLKEAILLRLSITVSRLLNG